MTKVVVVDNDPHELLHTVACLKDSGAFEAIVAFEDSIQAVDYIKMHRCDVVFTEVEMTGINGFDLIRILGNRHPEICLAFITNKENYALQAFEYGATDFILKPIDPKSIGRILKKFKHIQHQDPAMSL